MIGSPAMNRLCSAALQHEVFIVMGANEKLSEDSGSLYNTQFLSMKPAGCLEPIEN